MTATASSGTIAALPLPSPSVLDPMILALTLESESLPAVPQLVPLPQNFPTSSMLANVRSSLSRYQQIPAVLTRGNFYNFPTVFNATLRQSLQSLATSFASTSIASTCSAT